MSKHELLAACRTLGVESEKAPQRDQFLPDSQPHSGTMGQEDGKKWAAAAHSQPTIPKSDRLLGMRLDKWLWCARFYKTRGLAVEEIHKGRISVNGQPAKPAREVRPGDAVLLRQGPVVREVMVRALSNQRGPAAVAQQLYEETAQSLAARARAAEQRRLAPEPAASLSEGRPTKRQRRDMEQLRQWDDRWSASIDAP
ncbi:ribosomal 50S subunit-recycling heat shock protein [Extensimonas vulgaris]|uniref:Ribosomal 50S subunit-recycling heat shock protein n=2 Tax=Extensimonas vulgaris TaxID=1031594 RepID=A0A369ADQ3_9BURK|nr:ribosomal 50S subunit-recycling heat shock protein [Extensimonas vulgaris]TWI34570.1 ribosomal 50S subunit-recycling heat shock protein [Extensimonas vulgaris]